MPDFVDGMVSIAQRGRSLGMHMLLATQRPAGVVTPQIKANTDLRIALRVASADDSRDVIDAPDAARLSRRTPGRAWVRRTGHGTTELVQVAWVGGREPLHDAAAAVRVAPFTARDLGGDGQVAGERVHPRSDLDRLVGTTTAAFVRSGLPQPRRPWLPALARTCGFGPTRSRRSRPAAPGWRWGSSTGRSSRPSRRTSSTTPVGHLLVYGTSGSGKTELLRTVAPAATTPASPAATARPRRPPERLRARLRWRRSGRHRCAAQRGRRWSPEAQLERVLRLIRMLQRHRPRAQPGAGRRRRAPTSRPARPLHAASRGCTCWSTTCPAWSTPRERRSPRRSHVDLLLGSCRKVAVSACT